MSRIQKKSLLLLWILLLATPLLWQCAHPPGNISQDQGTFGVSFRYRDDQAKKVCVVGNFNQWSPQSHCMKKTKDIWTLTVSLPTGRYQYLFVIDDRRWETDPEALLTEDSGFGTKNSVLVVE